MSVSAFVYPNQPMCMDSHDSSRSLNLRSLALLTLSSLLSACMVKPQPPAPSVEQCLLEHADLQPPPALVAEPLHAILSVQAALADLPQTQRLAALPLRDDLDPQLQEFLALSAVPSSLEQRRKADRLASRLQLAEPASQQLLKLMHSYNQKLMLLTQQLLAEREDLSLLEETIEQQQQLIEQQQQQIRALTGLDSQEGEE